MAGEKEGEGARSEKGEEEKRRRIISGKTNTRVGGVVQ
jgi:hypothetical protein